MSGTRTIAIVQSNYIPWKGYFDLIASCDEFILYDDMQFTKRDWRNRNQIKTPQGLQWLTIPVETKGKFSQKIKDTRISDRGWAADHLSAIRYNYAKAACFEQYWPWLQGLYEKAGEMELLSQVNYLFLDALCREFGIGTKLSWSMDYTLSEGKTQRLVDLVRAAGGNTYLSGPAAKDYLEPELFSAQGIELRYMDYSGYAPYPQCHGEFVHGVTALDLLLNTGASARDYLKVQPKLRMVS